MALLLTARAPAGPDPAPFRMEEGRISIGRSSECDWMLPDATQQISARHCEIAWVRDGYAVADVSTNGTLLNGERLTAARRLGDGDVLTVGGYRIAVTMPDVLSVAIPAAAAAPGDEPSRALARALGTLLATRARQRREIGMRQADAQAGGPLAQSDAWAALAALPPAEAGRAIDGAVAAIDRHNAAALMAMQQALRDVIAAIAPQAITREVSPRPGLDDDQRDAALWRGFVARYQGTAKGAEDFTTRFATLFRDAYAKLAERS